MASSRWFSARLVVVAVFFASLLGQSSALHAEYCSSLNTAQTGANSSIYQSNGLCHNFCLADYAFAILQDATCWCSNDAPGITTSVDDCNLQCPGYPDDLCGSSDGLFGYFALTKTPTATIDESGSAATSSSGSDQSLSDTTSSSTPSTSTPYSSSTHITSSSSSPTSTWTPTPVTSLETVTGQVRTVTVTPTVPPNSQSLTGVSQKSGSGGLSTGGAVGLTIGLVALVALISSIIYFCWRRRQRERAEEFAIDASRRGSSAGLGGPVPSRTMSENSRYVLGTDGRQVVETWEPDARDTPGSRRSRLMPVDPRLDPFAPVYQRGENKSRESVNTIRDDHDYSRRVHQQGPILRATNPDE